MEPFWSPAIFTLERHVSLVEILYGMRGERTAWYTSQGKQYPDKGSSGLKKEYVQPSIE